MNDACDIQCNCNRIAGTAGLQPSDSEQEYDKKKAAMDNAKAAFFG